MRAARTRDAWSGDVVEATCTAIFGDRELLLVELFER
jgi:hypothetical protein